MSDDTEFHGYDKEAEVDALWHEVEALHAKFAELDVPFLAVVVPKREKVPDDGGWETSYQCATYLKAPPHSPSTMYAAYELIRHNSDMVASLALKLLTMQDASDDDE